MSRRERKLLIVTLLVVVAGVATWLGRGSDAPPAAAANAVEPAPHAVASSARPGGDAASPPLATALWPSCLRFDEREIRTLLEAAGTPPHPISEHDPFRRRTAPTSAGAALATERGGARGAPAIALEGVFHSLLARGALIGGRIYFEGDSIDGHGKLERVHPDRIELRHQGGVTTVVYQPQLRAGGDETKN